MAAVKFTVEVHWLHPSWFKYNNKYRLYINNDLLTERTWIWDSNIIIYETIQINVPTNSTNIARLDIIHEYPSTAQYALRNLQVINRPFISEQINDHTISFTLQ